MHNHYLENPLYFNTYNKLIKSKKKYNVISLFSGVGGMDLGFHGGFEFMNQYYERLPFDVIFANDIFEQAANVYEKNFKISVQRKSIDKLNLPDEIIIDKDIDVVLGGFPCQSFSYAGNRAGLNDPRGQLYKQMIRVVSYYQPKIFVAENVDGIRNSKVDGENGNALNQILNEFESIGYTAVFRVLNAADYGVPQTRKRVIIIGIRNDLGGRNDIVYPDTVLKNENDWITSQMAIDDLWDRIDDLSVYNHTSKDYSKAKFYPGKKMQGNNRIKRDKPAPTIRAEHHGNIEAHYRTLLEDEENMNGWRRLSIRECARLQSFPDSFIFNTSASSAYKMIGNAVPPVLAWHIAKTVAYMLSSETQLEFDF